jgi:hypothetical protein
MQEGMGSISKMSRIYIQAQMTDSAIDCNKEVVKNGEF